MRFLLDTHVFLWAVTDDPRLGEDARRCLLDGANELHLSLASVWEMAIKASLGKLTLGLPLGDLVLAKGRDLGLRLLPLELRHVLAVEALPFHHRDPFDRLLAAQALAEDLHLLSRDDVFDRYGVQRVW